MDSYVFARCQRQQTAIQLMSEIISYARIMECSRSTVRGKFNYQMRSFNEKPELVNQLCEYNLAIGIYGYDLYDDQTLIWIFQNNYYTTNEVERLIKMKIFA